MGRLKNETIKLDELIKVASMVFPRTSNKRKRAVNLLAKIFETIYRNKYQSIDDTILKSIFCEERIIPDQINYKIYSRVKSSISNYLNEIDENDLPILIAYLRSKSLIQKIP